MTKEKLLEKFGLYDIIQNSKTSDRTMEEYDELVKRAGLDSGDEETMHIGMDNDLLEYIDDQRITDAFRKIDKWYA